MGHLIGKREANQKTIQRLLSTIEPLNCMLTVQFFNTKPRHRSSSSEKTLGRKKSFLSLGNSRGGASKAAWKAAQFSGGN